MTEEKNDQRRLQSLLLKIQSYQGALQELSREAVLVERSVLEISAAIQAIEELPKSKESEALVPIGAGVFTKAQMLDKDNVIIAVGGGIHLQKTAAEAKTYLEYKKTKLEEHDKKVRDQIQKLNAELEDSSKEAEELYIKLQGG